MGIQKQYDFYRAQGLTHEGALGMLGNGAEESNNISYRKQGDFSAGYSVSNAYTAQIDNGTISRAQFCNGTTGYGLYQWTYQPRQEWLYDASKREGCSIGDEDFQLRFSVWELRNHFRGVWDMLTTSHNTYECVKKVCEVYENPAIWNTGARYQAALAIEKQLKAKPDPTPTPKPTPTPEPAKETYWPPRMICRGMSGTDVELAQVLLKIRGYAINYISGKFDELLVEQITKFQSANGLDADGIIGPLTWAKLLQYGG